MFSHYNMTETLKAIQKLHYNSKNMHKKTQCKQAKYSKQTMIHIIIL